MNQTLKFDIIVVGAGPSGSMAAQTAASHGRNVCLIERKNRAGFPVRCGEGIGFKGAQFNNFDVDEKWIKSHVYVTRLISPDGTEVEVNEGADSYILDREIMDLDLVNQAIACGAEYFPGTTIRSLHKIDSHLYSCSSSTDHFVAPIVILAEGIESRLARDVGWSNALKPEDIDSCAFCRVKHDAVVEDACIFYVGSTFTPAGYLWVFPRGNKEANVGLGVLGSHSDSGMAKRFLKNFVDSKFPGAIVTHLHCGGVPAGVWTKPLVRDGVMLVGDTARQVISLTGAGINYSIYSGKLAGKIASEAINNKIIDYKHLLKYEVTWANGLGKQQVRSYALKNLLLKNNNDIFFNSIAKSLSKKRKRQLSVLGVFLRTFITNPKAFIKALLLFR